MLKIAITKGRIEKQFTELMKESGFEIESIQNKNRKLCIETKKLLSYHADATLRVCDLQFLSENLPFSLNPSEDSCWEECKNPEAAKLFELHVIEPLRKCFLRGQD